MKQSPELRVPAVKALKRQDLLSPGLFQHLGHCEVDRGASADDPFPSGNRSDNGRTGPVAERQQQEEDPQREEDELQHPVLAEGAQPHKEGEEPPHKEVPAHIGLGGGDALGNAHIGKYPEGHQREPEEAVGGKGGHPEGVAFAEFEDAGDHLRDAAVKDPHRKHHPGDGKKARVVDVQEHGGHTEAHQAEGGGVS